MELLRVTGSSNVVTAKHKIIYFSKLVHFSWTVQSWIWHTDPIDLQCTKSSCYDICKTCISLPLIRRQLQGQDTDIANSSIALFLVLSTEELTTSRLNNILANCNHYVVQILFTMWGNSRNERHYLLFYHTCSCNLHNDSPLSSPHLPAQPDPLVLLSNSNISDI